MEESSQEKIILGIFISSLVSKNANLLFLQIEQEEINNSFFANRVNFSKNLIDTKAY